MMGRFVFCVRSTIASHKMKVVLYDYTLVASSFNTSTTTLEIDPGGTTDNTVRKCENAKDM